MRFLNLLIVIILLISCKESEQEKIGRIVNEWNGKVISFPDSMCLTSYKNDTVETKYVRERSSYTILNYVDTIGCISCRLQPPRWKDMIEELDSIYPKKVNCLMVFYPKAKRKLIKHLRHNHFDYFVYIDEKDTINRINNFSDNENFCTFLLDKNDKIVAIGNPVLRPKVRELYYTIISGKTMLPLDEEQTLTAVSLSKDEIDLGNFLWNKEREAEFIISNTGKAPLVINDVITSCGCTTVAYTKKPVFPGENTILKVNYKAEQPEHFNKTITIYCNVKNGSFELKIRGNAE